MLTAKKLVAVCFRMLSCGSILYLVITVIMAASMFGRLSPGACLWFVGWGLLSALLFIYSLPLAGFIAGDIDRSE